ncbi:unnamed protein product [Paramecium pentaurelia]|uniref:RING-type domain-containing protein n=1 Tax=Paramecium pentaurelia TaxID=43138 RepID=A0A8S1VX56_9CILI|nr:unnamed protein product [Paramecium pentaurelia]
MSTQISNQKIKFLGEYCYQPPQNLIQQQNYQNNLPNHQHTQNSNPKISVRQTPYLNNSEPNKARSSSQFQVPLNPIHNTFLNLNEMNLYEKTYEKSINKPQIKDEYLNTQYSQLKKNIRDNDQQSINCQSYVYKINDGHNNSDNTNSQYQNQPQIYNFIQNRNNNTNNQTNQKSYSQDINQQFLQTNQKNNSEFNCQQNSTNSQLNYYNNNQYQVQNYPTGNQFIKNQGHISIVQASIEQKQQQQNQQVQQDDNFEVSEDLTQSITRSISYSCKHCQARIFHEIIQLDCYHFYHPQCFQDHLDKQIDVQTYRPLKCHCQKKISESQIKNVLKLNQKSDLIDKLQKKQISTIYKMYNQILKLQKCNQCDFFWVADQNDNFQKTYYCQQCEKNYYKK